MTLEQGLAELTPLQREIVRAALFGEDRAGNEDRARHPSMTIEAPCAARFLACGRLRQEPDKPRHSEP